jgi:ketosteroid isomerase-like protein
MSQENVELARRTWELWSQGADDEVARRLAPDVEWHHQIGLGTPAEGIYRGREEVLELSTTIRDSFGVIRGRN